MIRRFIDFCRSRDEDPLSIAIMAVGVCFTLIAAGIGVSSLVSYLSGV
jgi:hypothetical protein